MNQPVAVVLGGTYPHKSLLNNLKLRGYHTVLIDYLENPPAKTDADEHIQESTLDKDKVLEIAKERNASLVIATCIDQANVTACYVAEKLNLPAPYSYEVALSVTNKRLMKEIMVSNGIPTSKHVIVNNKNDYKIDNLRFPVIVKPTDSNSSKGVRKASNLTELELYVTDALEISRNQTAIIEEFIDGIEFGADCYIHNKKVTILTTKERRKIPTDKENPIQQIQGSYWPANLTTDNLKKLKIIANKIAEVFHLDNTPLMIQAILNNDDISIIEFAPRIGGGHSYSIIPLQTGFDIIDSAVNSFLGIPVLPKPNPIKIYFADVFIYTKPCFFGAVKGYEKLKDNKTIEYINVYKAFGSEIGNEMSSNNRIGGFTVKSDSKEGLSEKIKNTINGIEVVDIHGIPVMKKNIYTY
jgi:biotin carboxylase